LATSLGIDLTLQLIYRRNPSRLAQTISPDPTLLEDYDRDDIPMDILPELSVTNVRELLRTTLPLPQLSPEEAAVLVISHLDNRTRSRRSKLKRHRGL